MALYLVSYDIEEKNNDYQSLWDELDTLNAVQILYSEWAVPYSGAASDLVKQLRIHIEKGDKILARELFNSPDPLRWSRLKISSDAFKKLFSAHARRLS
jgi:hypothetical protein